MNKLLMIYGVLIPTIIITSLLSKAILIFWFVAATFVAMFHNLIFQEKQTINGTEE